MMSFTLLPWLLINLPIHKKKKDLDWRGKYKAIHLKQIHIFWRREGLKFNIKIIAVSATRRIKQRSRGIQQLILERRVSLIKIKDFQDKIWGPVCRIIIIVLSSIRIKWREII